MKRLKGLVDPSTMLVVDLLHEFELGIWKALFVHLIRILYTAGQGSDELVVEFDRRSVVIIKLYTLCSEAAQQISEYLNVWSFNHSNIQ